MTQLWTVQPFLHSNPLSHTHIHHCRYCPNLTLIDTPGLISAAPGKKNSGLQGASRAIEAMVRQKMEQPELIM